MIISILILIACMFLSYGYVEISERILTKDQSLLRLWFSLLAVMLIGFGIFALIVFGVRN